MMSHNDDEFVTVSKKKSYRKQKCNNNILVITDVLLRAKYILEKYKPYAVYLYGSTARRKNNKDSDIDIFIIWKKYVPDQNMINIIHDELVEEFKRRVDVINYSYNGKSIKISSSDSCFIQNIINDAVSIIEPDEKYKVINDILFDFDCYYE